VQEERFLTLSRAALVLGIDRKHLRQLVDRGELPAYSDPLDLRKVLISTVDLARLHQPRLRAQPSAVAAVA
jgi:excisionase family DNA binding protein